MPRSVRLVRAAQQRATAPLLDPPQQRVVDHRGGRLLVLAGPGTGKTTTIVETVAARIESAETDRLTLDQVLVLTFGRRAAESVRERVASRLDRVARAPYAMTFHSYAYSLLRRNALLTGTPVPQLLTGPEQLLVVRELFAGEIEEGLEQWPEEMRPLLRIRAFEREVRDVMMRALEHGLDGAALARLGRANARPEWIAIGGFLDRYLARFDIDLVLRMDYSELVRGAGDLFATNSAVAQEEWDARKLVIVDEYQDTDPAQERLLRGLVGAGAELVVVGDPDQSIYAFRGAEVDGILEFAQRFASPGGAPVEIISLRSCHRFGAAIADAAASVAARLPAVRVDGVSAGGAMGRPEMREHRDLIPRSDSEGQFDIRLCATASAEMATIADELRRAHLHDGIAWTDMAVLVRTAAQMSALQRGLTMAGVPVVVAGDEIPLADQLVVRALRMIVDATRDAEGRRDSCVLTAEDAEALLIGPFGGSDVMAVRRLRRALRDAELAAQGQRSSDELLVEALLHPETLTDISPRHTAAALRVARILAASNEATGEADAVLWTIWQATGRAGRWQEDSLAGGEVGRIADNNLDAVVALFDACARYTERVGSRGQLVSFFAELAGQEIPGESMAERAPHGEAVRLLTAHRAKGLEWELVVVAGVQEGIWPDLRLRRSYLGAEALADVVNNVEATPTMLATQALSDERRLFFVALTRARERLLVTAVSSVDDADPLRPSRFVTALAESDEGDLAITDARARRPLALPDLVVELRAVVVDVALPESLRRAAAARLARLAEADVRGAEPSSWWASTPWSDERPLVEPGDDVVVSPSAVESFGECALRWLLSRAVGLGTVNDSLQTGNVIHALVEIGERDHVDVPDLKARLERVQATQPDTWVNRRQAERAARMLDHFAEYQRSARPLVGYEVGFEVRVPRAGDGDAVLLGRVDRLERDEEGRAFVADLKTGKSSVKKTDLDSHAQLGVYQLAVQLGGFAHEGLTVAGGAALVQLGQEKLGVQNQVALDDATDPQWANDLVLAVAAGMAGGEFAPTINERCRMCEVRTSCPAQAEGDGVVQ